LNNGVTWGNCEKRVCSSIVGIKVIKIWELFEMESWVVLKIDLVTKIGTWLHLYGQFPIACVGPLQKM
jgi:hypothetical protein